MHPAELFDPTGKTATVTGGANGVGRASCRMLANIGAQVVVADLKLAGAQRTAAAITDAGGKARAKRAPTRLRWNSLPACLG